METGNTVPEWRGWKIVIACCTQGFINFASKNSKYYKIPNINFGFQISLAFAHSISEYTWTQLGELKIKEEECSVYPAERAICCELSYLAHHNLHNKWTLCVIDKSETFVRMDPMWTELKTENWKPSASVL